jgi:hypothetical protein
LYGKATLYISFSLPKVYNNSNSNRDNVESFRVHVLDERLNEIFKRYVYSYYSLPLSIISWNVSRCDFFINHKVDRYHVPIYINTYSLLTLPRYKKYTKFESTCYLMSNFKKGRPASVVLRIYDKDEEMKSRNKHMELINTASDCEDINGLIRIEIQARRGKLAKLTGKTSVTAADVFDVSFQKHIINDYIHKLGLDRKILCRSNFRTYTNSLSCAQNKKHNIIDCARYIRNGKKCSNVSIYTLRNYIKELKKQGVHIITSDNIDLIPVKLL